jgi:chromate transporter
VILLRLMGMFAFLSLMAVGGANALVPEMQRLVAAQGWMDAHTFAALFALAQTAPGPNMLVVTLVGWHVAGVAGALAATAGFVVPAGLLTYGVARLWHAHGQAPWRKALQAGLTPVTVGLVMAAAVLLCEAADTDWRMVVLTVVSAAVMLGTRLHPLWVLGAGAALGALGAL